MATAAHCVLNDDPNSVVAAVGLTIVNQPGRIYKFQRIVRHPYYNSNNPTQYDFALLQTSETISFNSYVQPAKLPSSSIGGNMWALAVGFGAINVSIYR
jgi:secreted trypsin-like serine protease